MDRTKGLWPALTLFFLAPAIGELLSSSSPPAEFFKPGTLLLLAGLYGSGALLVRELRLRWGQGGWTVLALGAAYGLVEEGLACKSFFDPHWPDVGLLGSYGRWAGTNWVWSLHLTLFHALFSITIPILLVELLFPAQRRQPWLGRRGRVVAALLLLAVVLFLFLGLPYQATPLHYLLTAGLVLGLGLLARRLPVEEPTAAPPSRVPARPLWFALLGLGGTLATFLIIWALPALGLPAWLALLGLAGVALLAAALARHLARRGAWQDPHRLALAGGGLLFFVLLAPLVELDAARPDDTRGMALVGLATLLGLLLLWRRVRRRAADG